MRVTKDVLIRSLETSCRTINKLISNAYTFETGPTAGFRCKTCHSFSPMERGKSSFTAAHSIDCMVGDAIVVLNDGLELANSARG